MKYRSTRGGGDPVSLSDAIRRGQAGDGGLFMPERLPRAPLDSVPDRAGLADTASAFLAPFFEGDPLAAELGAICKAAFDFDTPLVQPDADQASLHVLELFHGPTGAFKDYGARFLMACLDRLGEADAPFTVLAATSGDTGGAVGCAAEGRAGVRAVILYPEGRVSAFQEHQLTCWDRPVEALKVQADFDSCQALVKQAFRDEALTRRHRLTSANSINIARLLPQAAYIAFAARRVFGRTGRPANFIIPTGNLGHGVAAQLAKACGAPIGEVQLATNTNATLADWAASGRYAPRTSVQTIANAMDVGAPSNFERLAELVDRPLAVTRVTDETIRARIAAVFRQTGYVACPHTACGFEAHARLPHEIKRAPWVIAATAHPYKFADIVDPILGRETAPSPALKAVLDRPARATSVQPELANLAAALDQFTEAA
ncbi:MAG: threonine synthase [Oceanicaulis sp.]